MSLITVGVVTSSGRRAGRRRAGQITVRRWLPWLPDVVVAARRELVRPEPLEGRVSRK